MQRAVARTGYADFWQLYRHNALPGETKNYVPGILAAVIMAKNPKQYGLTDVVPDAPVKSDTVTTEYAISMPLVADVTDSSVAEIVALNPALLRLATPKDIPYDLHLPAGTKQEYMDRVKEIPEEDRASWRFHVVKSDETLEDIATAMHTRASEIATVNEIAAGDPPKAGDALVIPVATKAEQQRYKAQTRRYGGDGGGQVRGIGGRPEGVEPSVVEQADAGADVVCGGAGATGAGDADAFVARACDDGARTHELGEEHEGGEERAGFAYEQGALDDSG